MMLINLNSSNMFPFSAFRAFCCPNKDFTAIKFVKYQSVSLPTFSGIAAFSPNKAFKMWRNLHIGTIVVVVSNQKATDTRQVA